MLDKVSGKMIYAVMSLGGFLSRGGEPAPVTLVKHDELQGGYVVDLDHTLLEGVPTYKGEDSAWTPDS